MSIRTQYVRPLLAAFALLLTFSSEARSQQPAEGEAEVLGFVGGVTDGGGATFGGGVHYAFTPRVLLAVEAAYLTGGQGFSGFGVDVDSHGFSIDGNLHYLFPSTTNVRFTPYLLGGIGYVRATMTVSGSTSGSVSGSDTGLNIGGGARWQAGDNWGLRPEVKVLVSDNSSVRFSVGIYWRLDR